MNDLATRPTGAVAKLPVQFRLEIAANADQVVQLINDILPIRQENFATGYGALGEAFQPDFQLIAQMIHVGAMRFVTARAEGRIIGLQQWMVAKHPWSTPTTIAVCDSIIGGRKRGIDIVEFCRYGSAAMRAIGANYAYFTVRDGSSFERSMLEAGARKVDTLMIF